jgi:hypothetical protein
MAITNEQAVKFTNNSRALAEKMRSLDYEIQAALVTWFAYISSVIPNDTQEVSDRRTAEGVSRLTGSDVTNLVAQMIAYKALMDGVGVRDVISKPTVRTLEV